MKYSSNCNNNFPPFRRFIEIAELDAAQKGFSGVKNEMNLNEIELMYDF
jgi:hypothetical protein